MIIEDRLLLQKTAFICFASSLKGQFTFKNLSIVSGGDVAILIDVLKDLGQDITYNNNDLTINSHGAFHLLRPEKEIDVKGSKIVFFALSGLFASYDYNVIFVDSTQKLNSESFHSPILALSEMGVRFKYAPNFGFPISMEGSSNLVPMDQKIINSHSLIVLTLLTAGLHSFASINIEYDDANDLKKILQALNANVKCGENSISLCLHSQNIKQNIELNILNI
jgi:5-enolpyruvylshikimate-3-phosphate synthase